MLVLSSSNGIVNSFVKTPNPLEYASTVRFCFLLIGLAKTICLSLNPTFTCNSGTVYTSGLIFKTFAPIVIGSIPNTDSKTTSVFVALIDTTSYSESFGVINLSPTAINLLPCSSDNTSVYCKVFNLYLLLFNVASVPVVLSITSSSKILSTSKSPLYLLIPTGKSTILSSSIKSIPSDSRSAITVSKSKLFTPL